MKKEISVMRNKLFLEYVWLDGYKTQNLRSKIKVIDYNQELNGPLNLKDVPEWNFDGSSTKQAPGDDSECILHPVRLYQQSGDNGVIVLCEVNNSDGTPHISNTRRPLAAGRLHTDIPGDNDHGFWWGFEQEYFMMKNGKPVGFPPVGYPKPQGEFYCAVGSSNVEGRVHAEWHMYECLEYGIEITGINAEVTLGQWEYQCFNKDTLKACDDLWVSRYILHKLTEREGITIDITPKPIKGDWNGSGCHTNFSNAQMRGGGSKKYFDKYLSNLAESHDIHIENYGESNDQRLTGAHETQHISKFSYGVGDRGASIRIPVSVEKQGWLGYLEDRRPASNCDPYKVAKLIIEAQP
jgi:glutamine synthetase